MRTDIRLQIQYIMQGPPPLDHHWHACSCTRCSCLPLHQSLVGFGILAFWLVMRALQVGWTVALHVEPRAGARSRVCAQLQRRRNYTGARAAVARTVTATVTLSSCCSLIAKK